MSFRSRARCQVRDRGRDQSWISEIHPTQVNTPLLMNEAVYRLFCSDVENPGQDDLAPASPAMHMLPVPWVEPVDISNAALFLASDEGRYVRGLALAVDAGGHLIA